MAVSADQLIQEAVDALRRGDGATATTRLHTYLQDFPGAEKPWLLLAQANRLTGDQHAEENALKALLDTNIRDLPALLFMGGLKARQGDDRAAGSWYQAALNVAAAMPDVPPTLAGLLAGAQNFMTQSGARYEAHLLDQLSKAGIKPAGRVSEAIDLLIGKRQLYQQAPTSFYFPGLPQRQFYERTEFDWMADFEAQAPAMKAELEAILEQDREFAPYVVSQDGRPQPSNPLRDDPSWGALYFWQNGTRISDNADRAPATMAALEHVPFPVIGQRSPMALYSLLKPGTHITPHHGLLNTRLICHLPLIVPGDCALRVGNETREWREGETLIFDDSFEHEAWNRSNKTRIVLLFEIWRPEISEEERVALTAIFEAINVYSGVPEDRG